MSTISTEERREVARRLRENAEAHPDMSLILNLAFADDSLKPDGAMEWKVTSHDAAMRLADLIEPSCDRDALLALADKLECDGDCNGCDMGGGIWCGAQVYAACRIREACGVYDHAG